MRSLITVLLQQLVLQFGIEIKPINFRAENKCDHCVHASY